MGIMMARNRQRYKKKLAEKIAKLKQKPGMPIEEVKEAPAIEPESPSTQELKPLEKELDEKEAEEAQPTKNQKRNKK